MDDGDKEDMEEELDVENLFVENTTNYRSLDNFQLCESRYKEDILEFHGCFRIKVLLDSKETNIEKTIDFDCGPKFAVYDNDKEEDALLWLNIYYPSHTLEGKTLNFVEVNNNISVEETIK